MSITNDCGQCGRSCPIVNRCSYRCAPQCCRPYSPCRPCPGRPGRVPDITCTPGYRFYLKETADQSGVATIQDVFNSFDGGGPYTVTSVEIVGTQQAVYDAQIIPIGGSIYQVTAEIHPFVRIHYRDNYSYNQFKYANIVLPVQATFEAQGPVRDIDFISYLDSATATKPVLTNNTLTFSYTVNTTLFGVSEEPDSFAVVDESECPVPSNLPVRLARLLPVASSCHLALGLGGQGAVIRFTPVGTAPYTVTSVLPIQNGSVDLLEESVYSDGEASFHAAFPVEITFVSNDGITTTQTSYLLLYFTLVGFSPIPNYKFLLHLYLTGLTWYVYDNIIYILRGTLDGTVSQTLSDPISVIVTPSVNCGGLPGCTCEIAPVPPKPTA